MRVCILLGFYILSIIAIDDGWASHSLRAEPGLPTFVCRGQVNWAELPPLYCVILYSYIVYYCNDFYIGKRYVRRTYFYGKKENICVRVFIYGTHAKYTSYLGRHFFPRFDEKRRSF